MCGVYILNELKIVWTIKTCFYTDFIYTWTYDGHDNQGKKHGTIINSRFIFSRSVMVLYVATYIIKCKITKEYNTTIYSVQQH